MQFLKINFAKSLAIKIKVCYNMTRVNEKVKDPTILLQKFRLVHRMSKRVMNPVQGDEQNGIFKDEP